MSDNSIRLTNEGENETIEPLNNVLSGCVIKVNLGEGILDFIYANFNNDFENRISTSHALHTLSEFLVQKTHKIAQNKFMI